MALTASAYLAELQALLPPGAAWNLYAGVMTDFLTGLAQEPARIAGRADDLLLECNPLTAVETLPEWEAEYQITPPEGATTEERQLAVWHRHVTPGDIKMPYFVALAAAMGYTIRIDDYVESEADWLCSGDPVTEEPWQFFQAGISMSGDTLAMENAILPWIWDVVILSTPNIIPTPDLATRLEILKPAHFLLNYIDDSSGIMGMQGNAGDMALGNTGDAALGNGDGSTTTGMMGNTDDIALGNAGDNAEGNGDE
jgi:uncharacterized protein YmfQ (DUF2313 family)